MSATAPAGPTCPRCGSTYTIPSPNEPGRYRCRGVITTTETNVTFPDGTIGDAHHTHMCGTTFTPERT